MLYGAFALLRKIAIGEPVADLDEKQTPYAPVRWVNQWDNLDGTIERGYGGRSIFWDKRPRARGPDARERLRPPARVARHQRLLHQQRQRRSAACSRPISAADRADRRSVASVGRADRASSVDFGSPQDTRRARYLRPAGSQGDRMVEGQGGRDLSRGPRSRRLRAEGRFRRPRRSFGIRPHPRRRRQRGRARARSRTAACSSTAASSTTTTWTGTI